MKRITLVFGVVVVMVAMIVALAAPAMAKKGGNSGGNGGNSFNSSGSSFNSSGGVTHFSGGDFGGSFRSSGSDFDGFSRFDSFSDFDGFFSNSDIEQEAVSGDIDLEADISLSGDNSNQSAPVVQFANTGNNQDALVVDQFGSEIEDFEFEGGFISFDPELEFASDQEVEQSSAA